MSRTGILGRMLQDVTVNIEVRRLKSTARDAAVSLSAGAMRGTAIAMLSVSLVLSAVVALYLVKSAMGINLMAGPSPLHDLYVLVH